MRRPFAFGSCCALRSALTALVLMPALYGARAQAEHQTTLMAIDIRPFSCQKQFSRHRTGPNSDIPVAIYRYNVTPERFSTLRD